MGQRGKRSIPRSPTRTAVLGAACAVAAIGIAVGSAGTAEAKTHHGPGAPGNAFFAPQTGTPTSRVNAQQTITSTFRRSTGGGGTNGGGPGTSSGRARTGSGGPGTGIGGPRMSLGGPDGQSNFHKSSR
jgi:hypothetical protein